jgi:hypothetical protein
LKKISIVLVATGLGCLLAVGCSVKQDFSDTNAPSKPAPATSSASDSNGPPRTPVQEPIGKSLPMPPQAAAYLKQHPAKQ